MFVLDRRSAPLLFLLAACSSPNESSDAQGGASSAQGGASSGGASSTQGGSPSGGSANDGGATSGGAVSSGGRSNGGGQSSGGAAAQGGSATTGGVAATGGMSSGGGRASTGGRANGGASNGGANSGGVSNGGGRPSGGAASSGGASSAGAGGNGSAGAPIGAAEVCARWNGDRMNMREDAWNGDAASCKAGDMSAASRETALRIVNLYRALAQLPAVTLDATRNQQDQECALMMHANGSLNHEPPTTWKCYTADGAKAAGNGNLAGMGAVAAVDDYMLDPGNATTLGHRRWILSNSLGPIGLGSTGKYSCMWALGGTGKAGKPWLAWPPPGAFPLEALTASRKQSIDTTGWSLQSDSINLASAQVTVTLDGTNKPVTVTQLEPNYGARYALRFNPMGWSSGVGTYHVSVTGISTPIEYDVNIVPCTQ